MTDPSKETIAAALRLAEAMIGYTSNGKRFSGITGTIATADHDEVVNSLEAYRATLPKPLRTRAEVDAEIAALVRKDRAGTSRGLGAANSTLYALDTLCAEPTAPEPAAEGEASIRVNRGFWCPATHGSCNMSSCMGSVCDRLKK